MARRSRPPLDAHAPRYVYSSIAVVTSAIAHGDLSKTIDAQVEGEMAELRDTVNDMVFSLRIFSSEVTRVSLEVGTKGQLGGQAVVSGVSGVWKELTDNVNRMAESECAFGVNAFC